MKTLGTVLISGGIGFAIAATIMTELINKALIADLAITDDVGTKMCALDFNKRFTSNDIVNRLKDGKAHYAVVKMFIDNSIKDDFE